VALIIPIAYPQPSAIFEFSPYKYYWISSTKELSLVKAYEQPKFNAEPCLVPSFKLGFLRFDIIDSFLSSFNGLPKLLNP